MSKIEIDEMGEYDVEELPENLNFPLRINNHNGSVDDAANRSIFIWEFPGMRRNLRDLRVARRRIAFLVRSLNTLHFGEAEDDTEVKFPEPSTSEPETKPQEGEQPETRKKRKYNKRKK